MRIIYLLLFSILLVSCKPAERTENHTDSSSNGRITGSSEAPVTSPGISKTASSLKQWQLAIDSTFDKVNVKKLRDKKNPVYVLDLGETDGDGITEFFACFDKSPPKCELPTSGKRDGFRKVHFFSDPSLVWSNLTSKYEGRSGKTFLNSYVSVKDCSLPKLFIESIYRGQSWLFLQQIGLMSDGSIIMERDLSTNEMNRENTHESVSETVHFALTDSEIVTLRQLSSAKQVLIRLTGKKGYVTLDKESTKVFVEGVTRLLRIHGAIHTALENVGDVKDVACPD